METLQSKYGTPDSLIKANYDSPYTTYSWLRNTSKPYNKLNFTHPYITDQNNMMITNFWTSINFALDLADGHFDDRYNVDKACGILFLINIHTSDGIVSSIDFKMVNSIRASKSVNYLDALMFGGAKKAAAKARREGNDVKLKF
jgi:hypothetical protein